MVIKQLIERIGNIGSNTLYFPGCHTKFKLKYEYNNYKEIFKKLKINHIEMKNFICCGLSVYEAGYKKEAKELAQKNYDRFKQRKIKKIITNSPSCVYMFNEIYPKLIRGWDIEVEHVSNTIYKALKKIKIKDTPEEEKLSYNDSPYLKNNDKSREIIHMFNGKIIEPIVTKEKSFCCGGHGGVSRNYPELAEKINKKRLSQFPETITKIVTPSAICFTELKYYDERVTELSTYILGKLRGQKIWKRVNFLLMNQTLHK